MGDPMRCLFSYVLATTLLLPSIAHAQTGSAELIKQYGSGPLATGVTFPLAKDLHYRIAWGVNAGPATADSVVPGFRDAASFLYVSDANGVPRSNVHLAIVVWGAATHSLLKN